MDNTQNIISFCTGYGGIELGLRRISPDFRTVAYVEIEAFAVANLVAKIEQGKMDAAPIWTDIKTFDGKPFRGKVHGLIAGYPCQPWSTAGKRLGTEDPRHLWPYIEEHISTIKPIWCFFENVSGHLTLGFDEVFKSLRDMGYKVEAGLFTAAETGAPHKRERLFILAYTGCNEQTGIIGNSKTENGETQSRRSSDRRNAKSISGSDGIMDNAKCKYRGLYSKRRINDTETRSASETEWPARSGQFQYEWEEPRTVEFGMGRTINGFKSRVDELRLLGNGVVPQTAELAFRTLMALFGKEKK